MAFCKLREIPNSMHKSPLFRLFEMFAGTAPDFVAWKVAGSICYNEDICSVFLLTTIGRNINPPLFVRKAGNEFPSNLVWVVLARQSLYKSPGEREGCGCAASVGWRGASPHRLSIHQNPPKLDPRGLQTKKHDLKWLMLNQFQHGIFVILVSLKFLLF